MILEVGKKYRTRDRETIVEIVDFDDSFVYWPYVGNIISSGSYFFKNVISDNWDSQGLYSETVGNSNDLVEEVTN